LSINFLQLEKPEAKKLEEIEEYYEFDDLFSWRKLSHSAIYLDSELKKENEKKKEEKKESMGFFKALFASEKEVSAFFFSLFLSLSLSLFLVEILIPI
jgi:hypothetical protein